MGTFFFPATIKGRLPASDGEEVVVYAAANDFVTKKWEEIHLHGNTYYSTCLSKGAFREYAESNSEVSEDPFLSKMSSFILKPQLSELQTPKLMGILNCTPDSFYPGSIVNKEFVKTVDSMLSQKPDIVDVGGESSRPGAERVQPSEELKRIKPVVSYINEVSDIPVSIDTRNSEVLEALSDLNIWMLNDISGLLDKRMRSLVKERRLKSILMHMRGSPENMQTLTHYDDLIPEMVEFYFERLRQCYQENLNLDDIYLDPGIGFAKGLEGNLTILKNIDAFKIGPKIAVGTSRKSFLGKITGNDVYKRLPETIATSLYLARHKVSILRVHDISENRDALTVQDRLSCA